MEQQRRGFFQTFSKIVSKNVSKNFFQYYYFWKFFYYRTIFIESHKSDYFGLEEISEDKYFIEKRLKLTSNFDFENDYFYNVKLIGKNQVFFIQKSTFIF